MRDFKKLKVWNSGIEVTKEVYSIVKQMPEDERFGIISQMTRAAVSIPSNIAEGGSRNSQKEYRRFLEIALGSAFELETQLIICEKLNWIDKDAFQQISDLIIEEQKMLSGLIKHLKD